MFTQEQLFQLLTQFAYEPTLVYSLVVGLLVASSFGLPVPEEITLVSAGLLGYLAQNPTDFPPPYEGAKAVHSVTLAIVCFFSVFLSDVLVFWIGRYGRFWIVRHPRFSLILQKPSFQKVEALVQKYGIWMAGVFRFTPGLRFPGHMSCGMMGLSPTKFYFIDGLAAALSVPTQVLLVSYYGEVIMANIKEFKIIVFGIIAMVIAVFIIKKLFLKNSKTLEFQ